MKAMPALLTVALFSMSVAACRSSVGSPGRAPQTSSNIVSAVGTRRRAASSGTPTGGYLKTDGDTDGDDETHHGTNSNEDDARNLLTNYGRKANRAVERAVTSVVKSYYTAAAAGDVTQACALLYGSMAAGLGAGQASAGGGPGNACAGYLSRLFKEEHPQLARDDVATMVVTSVRARSGFALAMLGFRATPEGEILLEREGSAWKMAALFDSQMP